MLGKVLASCGHLSGGGFDATSQGSKLVADVDPRISLLSDLGSCSNLLYPTVNLGLIFCLPD